MATPRKKSSKKVFGPRVATSPSRGRPVTGIAFAAELSQRVKAVKDRLGSRPAEPQPEWQRLTWRTFALRIGLTEEALRLRLRKAAPVPFSAPELAAICREFGVRAEYMLLGERPMLHVDLVNLAPALAFADLLHHHVARVIDLRTEQDQLWVASYLPDASSLLLAVEHGVADALAGNVTASLADRSLANASVRGAVADHVRDSTSIPDSSAAFFKAATKGMIDGSVLDIGHTDE